MKQKGYHDLKYKTFEDYLDYTLGKMKISKAFKPYQPKSMFRRSTPNYPSVDSGANATARKENQKYTGTLVKGIATMHKSNAVPVIDEQHAKDISSMRR